MHKHRTILDEELNSILTISMRTDWLTGALPLKCDVAELWLLPEGAVFDRMHHVLFVADMHLGKADSFRRLGVPVPDGANQRSLQRLSSLIDRCKPKELVFLGDLIHDYLPASHAVYEQLTQWRNGFAGVDMTLVIGNHDAKAGVLPDQCSIRSVISGTVSNGLCLLHEPVLPANTNGEFGLAGHIHPVARVRSRTDSVRVKCFWARTELLVLPAFGEFTGGYRIEGRSNESIFILDGAAVHKLPVNSNQPRAA